MLSKPAAQPDGYHCAWVTCMHRLHHTPFAHIAMALLVSTLQSTPTAATLTHTHSNDMSPFQQCVALHGVQHISSLPLISSSIWHHAFRSRVSLHTTNHAHAASPLQVTVCESHNIPGGAAHAWVQKGYHFESGPSLYSGMAGTGAAANPLALVLKAIDEPLDLIEYNQWNVFLPEGEFLTEVLLHCIQGGHEC